MVAPGVAHAGSQNWKWIRTNVIDRIEVAGYRRLGYHIRSVSGDREAYNVGNYSGLGQRPFTDIGQLQFTGRRVFGVLNFDATILDSRFTDPQGQKFSIDYVRDGWQINLGDIQGSLVNTNRFASFGRTLRGAQVGYRAGGFQAKAITSQAKARAQTVTVPGNGSSGPYYLQSSQIVPESERVQVDGQALQRGRDYVISYEIGSITFTTLAISPSSTIAITFEAFGTNAQRGSIDGAGLSYDFGKVGRIGVTAIRQVAKASTFGSTRLERFFGFGPPSTPYTLQFEPLTTRPITIRVNGVIQAEGVDYYFDTDNTATFFFTRFMPPTDEIDVTYTPKPRQTVDGDREVFGIDYRLPLGKAGTLTYAQAYGRLKNDINPSSGLAQGINLDYSIGPWSLRANARDIPAGYVSVESTTFNRNERAHDVNLSYQLNPRTRLTATQGNSVVTTRSISNTGDVFINRSRVTSSSAFYDFLPTQGGQPLKLGWDRRQSRVRSNPSRSDTFSLSTNRQYSKWDYRLGVNQTSGTGPTSLTAGAPQQAFSVWGLTSGASWRPSTKFTLDGQLSLNAVRSGDQKGIGRRQDINLSYLPSDKLSVSARYSDTDSGGVTGLGGFSDGSGVGLGDSGFSGSTPGLSFLGTTGSRLASIIVDFRPSDKFSVSVDGYKTRYSGSVSSNSETDGVGLSLYWALNPENRLTFRFDNSNTKFLASPQTSRATTLQGAIDGRLSDRFTYSLRGSTLLTGGTSAFQQNGLTFEAGASYRLRRRENLFFEFINGSSSGYLPQNDVSASLVYQYQLIDALALNVGYRYRHVRNRDAGLSSGAYRSGSLDIELSFSFPR